MSAGDEVGEGLGTAQSSALAPTVPVIEVRGVTKIYAMGATRVYALRGVDLTVQRGEMIAITGSSGSGKSTLMNILGCLDVPTSGDYVLDGVHVNGLSSNQLADLRNQKLGFVFQGFNLLARTSAIENVELPLLYDRSGRWVTRCESPTRSSRFAAFDKASLRFMPAIRPGMAVFSSAVNSGSRWWN